jgi:hypothetical protein
LVIGWLIALALAALVRAVLKRTSLDDRLAKWLAGEGEPRRIKAEEWIARGVFYLIMLFVLIAFLQVLDLTIVTQPLNQALTLLLAYTPRLLAAGGLLLAAWLVAMLVRFLALKGLQALKVDEKLRSRAGLAEEEGAPISKTVSDAVYWLVWLLFLPAILGALNLQGLLGPVEGMIDALLGFLPNLLGAGLILLVGWFVARIVQRLVTNLLAAIGTDRLSERVGLDKALGKQTLSGVLGLIVYFLILIPALIAALGALQLDAITEPATAMLNQILAAIPAILGAALLLAIAYVVGRVVAGLVTNLLASVGFNAIPVKLGLSKEEVGEGQLTPAQIVGYLVLVVIMLFASIEALELLDFALVADLVQEFTAFLGQIILGLIIFALGLYFANLTAKAVKASGTTQSRILAPAARISILVLATAMALRQMGLANEIINLAFGLLLGAIALAVALAFGLGSREIAGRELDRWLGSLKSEKPQDE